MTYSSLSTSGSTSLYGFYYRYGIDTTDTANSDAYSSNSSFPYPVVEAPYPRVFKYASGILLWNFDDEGHLIRQFIGYAEEDEE